MFAPVHSMRRCLAVALATAVLAAPAFALDTVKFMAPDLVGGVPELQPATGANAL